MLYDKIVKSIHHSFRNYLLILSLILRLYRQVQANKKVCVTALKLCGVNQLKAGINKKKITLYKKEMKPFLYANQKSGPCDVV